MPLGTETQEDKLRIFSWKMMSNLMPGIGALSSVLHFLSKASPVTASMPQFPYLYSNFLVLLPLPLTFGTRDQPWATAYMKTCQNLNKTVLISSFCISDKLLPEINHILGGSQFDTEFTVYKAFCCTLSSLTPMAFLWILCYFFKHVLINITFFLCQTLCKDSERRKWPA